MNGKRASALGHTRTALLVSALLPLLAVAAGQARADENRALDTRRAGGATVVHYRNRGLEDQAYRVHVQRYAHPRGARRHGGHHYRRGGRLERYGHHGRFDVPESITHARHPRYSRFYHGRVWYAPHRHHHRVFVFPEYGRHGVSYVPYGYCDGHLHSRGHLAWRSGGVSIVFEF